MERSQQIVRMDAEAMLKPRPSKDTEKPERCARDGNAAKFMASRGYMPHDKIAFDALCAWFDRFWGSSGKGLVLTGNVGTGKTMFAKLMISARYKFRTALELVTIWQEGGGKYNDKFWFDAYRIFDGETWNAKLLVIDELGREPLGRCYGIQDEVLDYVICQRYTDYQRTGAATIITSNLKMEQIEERYTARVCDRLREMCDVVHFQGQSLRGLK